MPGLALDVLGNGPQPVSAAAVAAVASARGQFSVTATGTVGNTTVETTIINSTGLSGSLTIPANTFTPGKSLLILGWGFLTNTGTPTLRKQIKLNGTARLDTTAFTMATIIGTNMWQLTAMLSCRTAGAGGTAWAQGIFSYFSAGGQQQNQQMVNAANFALDTTAAQTIDITDPWGVADPLNTISSSNLSGLLLG